jgi:hypothetical protein
MNITEIEAYWQGVDFSKPQPEINIGGERINDLGMFTKSHIAILKYNAGVRAFLPYYERLYRVTLAHMKLLA